MVVMAVSSNGVSIYTDVNPKYCLIFPCMNTGSTLKLAWVVKNAINIAMQFTVIFTTCFMIVNFDSKLLASENARMWRCYLKNCVSRKAATKSCTCFSKVLKNKGTELVWVESCLSVSNVSQLLCKLCLLSRNTNLLLLMFSRISV